MNTSTSRRREASVGRVPETLRANPDNHSTNSSRTNRSVLQRVKARCQVEAGLGLLTSLQCNNHSVPGSSRNGSHPSSPKSENPRSVTSMRPLRSPRSMVPVAVHQCLMDLTMFLPTPSLTMASSLVKRSECPERLEMPLGSQVYRKGKVSWPVNPYLTTGSSTDLKTPFLGRHDPRPRALALPKKT